MECSSLELYCDGSVNPKTKIGFGAYFIYNKALDNQNINIKKFENTSSTKLELEVLLWALEKEGESLKNKKVIVYTDCQNILTLFDRKERLQKNNYFTKTGKRITNFEIYKKFYLKSATVELSINKVKGHKKSNLKDHIDTLFNLVDKASRKALRDFYKKEGL